VEASAALERMRERLDMTFGRALTQLILASASNKAGCATIGLSDDEFTRLAEAVCTDQRVVDMWGEAGANDALRTWREMLS